MEKQPVPDENMAPMQMMGQLEEFKEP